VEEQVGLLGVLIFRAYCGRGSRGVSIPGDGRGGGVVPLSFEPRFVWVLLCASFHQDPRSFNHAHFDDHSSRIRNSFEECLCSRSMAFALLHIDKRKPVFQQRVQSISTHLAHAPKERTSHRERGARYKNGSIITRA
jgi:hypothetical protein